MSSILPVYFLSLLLYADAYFLKFWENGGRRSAPKTVVYRDDYVDDYWPEDNIVRIYEGNSKRSLALPNSCHLECTGRKSGENLGRSFAERPSDRPSRRTGSRRSRRNQSKCRRSRRVNSLLSRTLHARHDDTKYDVQPYTATYQYAHSSFPRNFRLRKQRNRRKDKCRCRGQKRRQMMCADVGYFHQVFKELERMMSKFLLEREYGEREAPTVEDETDSEEKPILRAEELDKEQPKVVDVLPDPPEQRTNRSAEKKKPLLHV